MPPRIRTTRASRALKENIDAAGNNVKPIKNISKVPRKALADKTNSASDDASLEIPKKSKKTITRTVKASQKEVENTKQNVLMKENRSGKPKQRTQRNENVELTNEDRPRRNRQLPKRFVENHVLNNLSNSKDSLNVTHSSSITIPKADNTPAKNDVSISDKLEPSPFKTPAKADNSLLTNRPRRICRLPSRFEDHSVSPNKYIPIQPANASTPIQQSKTKSSAPIVAADISTSIQQTKSKPSLSQIDKENLSNKVSKNLEKKQAPKVKPTRLAKIDALQKVSSDNSSDKSSPDSNNNAKGRSTRQRTVKVNKKPSPTKKNKSPIRKFLIKNQSPVKKIELPTLKNITGSPVKQISPEQTTNKKKLIDKNLSFKVLESKKNSQDSDKHDLDVYEFTFDPDEEPQPQKKKRKRPVAKKQTTKPKKVVYKSSYEQNISKALAALKNVVKSGKTTEGPKLAQITENGEKEAEIEQDRDNNNKQNNVNEVQNTNVVKETNTALNNHSRHECNYPSIRVEDIAADIEPSIDNYDDINYSPVNSPRPNVTKSPNASVHPEKSPERLAPNSDPLNLLEDFSFFDDQPVASSSMNVSVRHPLASPWRVEFGSLPIKWPNNTYVKPNMTPAVESSFINPEDSLKKKHVYTNMLPETNDMFPDVDSTPNLKQTSIISFIKEMAERSAKKKRGRAVSPMKAIYGAIVDTNNSKKSTKKATHTNNTSEETLSSNTDTSNEKENSKEEKKNRKRKNIDIICDVPAKSPRKQRDKDCTYFGFDESENLDTENVSPIKDKNNHKGRSLRSNSRAVLQEINGPTRAVLPVAAKTKIATSSDVVNKVYEELKSAADAPMFPEKDVVDKGTNIEDPAFDEDSQSVHLFEDIEVVHHVKPTRKSYGKAKKVTFRQGSTSDSDTQEPIVADHNESSDYDDLGDLTFEIPNVKEKKAVKKKKPKKLRTKKEEQEAEAWAANFNSMCEDIEEFPLLVE